MTSNPLTDTMTHTLTYVDDLILVEEVSSEGIDMSTKRLTNIVAGSEEDYSKDQCDACVASGPGHKDYHERGDRGLQVPIPVHPHLSNQSRH